MSHRITQAHTSGERLHWPELALKRLDLATSADKQEINLYSKLYEDELQVTLTVFSPPPPGRIPFADATQGQFSAARVGDTFKGSWSTHWFKVTATIPPSWFGREVHLLWNSHSEALVFKDGAPVQAFAGTDGDDHRYQYVLTECASADNASIDLYVEMACTGLFGNGVGGGWGGLGPNPTDLNKTFTLDQACISVFNRDAWNTLVDFIVITDMARHLPKETQNSSQALVAANHMLNVFRLDDEESWKKCREVAAEYLSKKNGERAHRVNALGHCHIDTAWLWSFDETKRKCARSWATQLELMRQFPEHKFACSQAQQFDWVKELYPQLYSRIKDAAKDGRFIPCGGTWVEMDCNIPSGESLSRQFLYGQHFFRQEFDKTCEEFWLPDTFGYAAQLPQICREAGIKYFLTQKLSWNQVNKFPHHTFVWEALDGSQVVTHFPPADNYCAQANVKELLHSVSNYKDREVGPESMMLFGFGDGGGGPTPLMLEKIKRLKDCDGMPRVEIRSLDTFWESLVESTKGKLNLWVGELYFEYHRGTYTSQAKTKLNNRVCEVLLHDIEYLATMAKMQDSSYQYPQEEIGRLWKLVLLNQFHDVIPGSSITEVYEDADRFYEDVLSSGRNLLAQAIKSVYPNSADVSTASPATHFINTLAYPRREVVSTTGTDAGSPVYKVCSVPAMSNESKVSDEVNSNEFVKISEADGLYLLENSFVSVSIDNQGRVVSLKHKASGNRDVIAEGELGHTFALFEDTPMYWDAWDVDVYHLAKRAVVNPSDATAKIVLSDKLRVSLQVSFALSAKSHISMVISLDAVSPKLEFDLTVDWHEAHEFLKVEFPLSVRTSRASYEIQYGHVERPTHFNTSHDIAKFEVCGQRWCDVAEHGFGVALVNDSKYGHSVHGNILRLSLLRSPKNPDPDCDMGTHRIKYALFPHTASLQDSKVIQVAAAFNQPLLPVHAPSAQPAAAGTPAAFVETDNPAIYLDAVKMAEDGSGDVIIRLYESHGGRAVGVLRGLLPDRAESIAISNILEDDVPLGSRPNAPTLIGRALTLQPFQLVTLRFKLK